MSAVPASLLAPRAPQVNLIPPEVASRRAAGKTRGMIALVLFGFALILGAATVAADVQKRSAESALADAKAQGASLQVQIDKFAAVPVVQKELANVTSARLFAGATEVRWQDLLRRMRAAMPLDINMATMSFANTSVLSVNAPVAGPFVTAGVGIVSFNGTSLRYPDAAALERAINSVTGLTDAWIPSVTRVVTEGKVSYTFSGTATVTAQALDLRFTDAWFVNRNREVADAYLNVYVDASEARLAAAKAGIPTGPYGGAADVKVAQADRDAAHAARETFTAMTGALKLAQEDLAAAATAQVNGEVGAEAAVAKAQGKVDFLGAGLDTFAAVVLAHRDASAADAVAGSRGVAAENLVTNKQAQLKAAQTALGSATENRAALQADVDYFTMLVSEAQGVLKKELASIAPAAAAVTAAREALVSATVAAQTVIDTADQAPPAAPKPKPKPTPKPAASPSPGASPSASATKGSSG